MWDVVFFFCFILFTFFFFKQKTAYEIYQCDWSSDVCSSDLNVLAFQGREAGSDPLTDLLRTGAQELVRQAVEVELTEVMARYVNRRTADGKAGVVRNGYLPKRELQTGVGPVTVKIPKIRAKTGTPDRKSTRLNSSHTDISRMPSSA